MHLCARDRLKRRLYTACKELIINLIISYAIEKRGIREVLYKETRMSYK